MPLAHFVSGDIELSYIAYFKSLQSMEREIINILADFIEAISIAIELDSDVVALDDCIARSEAVRLGLEVKGTLGFRRKLIELERFQCNIGELFDNLKSMNFRVKDNIFWEIFKDIKQNQRS